MPVSLGVVFAHDVCASPSSWRYRLTESQLEMLWFQCPYRFLKRNYIIFQKLTVPVLVPVPVTLVVKESIPVGYSSATTMKISTKLSGFKFRFRKKWNHDISNSHLSSSPCKRCEHCERCLEGGLLPRRAVLSASSIARASSLRISHFCSPSPNFCC